MHCNMLAMEAFFKTINCAIMLDPNPKAKNKSRPDIV